MLFHQSFADYIPQYLLGEDGMTAAYRAFCDWLSTSPQHGAEYRLRHLPAHLLEWGNGARNVPRKTKCSRPLGDLRQFG